MSGLIVLATGGTGGHVFPATAVASKLQAMGWRTAFMTDPRGRRYIGESERFHVVMAASPSGSPLSKAIGYVKIGIGVLQSLWTMTRDKPAMVVGFGSYTMFPPILAAFLLRIPIALHEQNAVLGRAHKTASRWAGFLAITYRMNDLPIALEEIAVVSGNPVRAPFEKPFRYHAPDRSGPIRIVIIGGSQGAQIFGTHIAEAIAALPAPLQARLYIRHQVRKEDAPAVRKIYASTAVRVQIATFFDDPHALLTDSHLVISRAGATIVAELTALGIPAILIPFARAIDQDQMGNARVVAGHGGAVIVTEDQLIEGELAHALNVLFKAPERLDAMADIARSLGFPKAAQRLADMVNSYANGNRNIKSFDIEEDRQAENGVSAKETLRESIGR